MESPIDDEELLAAEELDPAPDQPFTDDEVAGGSTGASGALPEQARRALVAILTQRYLSRGRNKAAWTHLLAYESDVRERLNDLFLDLIVDHEAEVAFKRQQLGDDVPKMLRREKPLSRDASFVLLFLVRECAYADLDDGPVVVSRDQIGEFLRAFREEGDSDGARFGKRVDTAINALTRPLQLLIPDPATDFLFTISPVVVPLVGVDEVQRLEGVFQDAANTSSASMADLEPRLGADEAAANEADPTGADLDDGQDDDTAAQGLADGD